MGSICTVVLEGPEAQPGKAVPQAQERNLGPEYAFESHQYAGVVEAL